MRPSLALNGSIVVASQPGDGVRLFDLDGRRLGANEDGAAAAAVFDVDRPGGVAMDDDRRVWVCEPHASSVVCFSAFGRPAARLVDGPDASGRDAPGVLGRPHAIDVRGDTDGLELVVASRGRRRHALQVFDEAGTCVRSLRPGGDSHGTFRSLEGVAFDGRFVHAVEAGGRVSIYRDLDHHFGFDAAAIANVASEGLRLRAVAPAGGGRVAVVSERDGVLLFGPGGAFLGRPIPTGPHAGGASDLEAPVDLVIERGRDDARRRVVVMDREGARIQVFSLVGSSFGTFDTD